MKRSCVSLAPLVTPVSSFEGAPGEGANSSWHRAAKLFAKARAVKQVLSRSLATVRSLFELIDRDGSGTISAEEFHCVQRWEFGTKRGDRPCVC